MPYIETKTNVSVPKDKEKLLKAAFADCISIFPGKSERWLMLSFKPDAPMYFGGSDAPCAILQVQVFGKVSDRDCERATAAFTEKVSSILDIPADRIYVKYEECSKWGWNGSNF